MNQLSVPPRSVPALEEPRVIAALEEYLADVGGGKPPDREAFLTRHAGIAAALAPCLDGLDVLGYLQPDPPKPMTSANLYPIEVAASLLTT
jgi:hypothetical protein